MLQTTSGYEPVRTVHEVLAAGAALTVVDQAQVEAAATGRSFNELLFAPRKRTNVDAVGVALTATVTLITVVPPTSRIDGLGRTTSDDRA